MATRGYIVAKSGEEGGWGGDAEDEGRGGDVCVCVCVCVCLSTALDNSEKGNIALQL